MLSSGVTTCAVHVGAFTVVSVMLPYMGIFLTRTQQLPKMLSAASISFSQHGPKNSPVCIKVVEQCTLSYSCIHCHCHVLFINVDGSTWVPRQPACNEAIR